MAVVRKRLKGVTSDALRDLVKLMAESLMEADAEVVCGASYWTRSQERVNSRNGYRRRRWKTPCGTVELEIPKLRQGTYFPAWLLQRGRLVERAMVAVAADCYVHGVSARKVDGLVRALGIEHIGRLHVSELTASLDQMVNGFRSRPANGVTNGVARVASPLSLK
jgi:putative transposase